MKEISCLLISKFTDTRYKMGRRKGRCSRKNRNVGANEEPDELTRAPHSFVVHR